MHTTCRETRVSASVPIECARLYMYLPINISASNIKFGAGAFPLLPSRALLPGASYSIITRFSALPVPLVRPTNRPLDKFPTDRHSTGAVFIKTARVTKTSRLYYIVPVQYYTANSIMLLCDRAKIPRIRSGLGLFQKLHCDCVRIRAAFALLRAPVAIAAPAAPRLKVPRTRSQQFETCV